MNNLTKIGLIAAGAALVAVGVFSNISTATPQQKIDAALTNLYIEAPEMKQILQDAQNIGMSVVIQAGTVDSKEEAITELGYNFATVTIDISRVIQAHDQLEPVLGHELFHIKDAVTMGLPAFLSVAAEEKGRPWGDRSLERSALLQENMLRARLIKTGRYPGMASTREVILARNRAQ